MKGVQDFVDKVQKYHGGADEGVLRRAYNFSEQVHRGQRRHQRCSRCTENQ